jgi:L-glyceraldehyde reductase
MSFGKIVTLSSGTPIPQIGLGTWQSKPKEVENAVCTNSERQLNEMR